MQAAANDLVAVLSIPYFWGQSGAKKNHDTPTAEAWVDRINNYATQRGWLDPEKIRNARSFMRSKAAVYFEKWLPAFLTDAQITNMNAHWGNAEGFLFYFRLQYAKVRTTADLSTGWANMQQQNDEPASPFCMRIHAVISSILGIIPAPQPADGDWPDQPAQLAAVVIDGLLDHVAKPTLDRDVLIEALPHAELVGHLARTVEPDGLVSLGLKALCQRRGPLG